ncbi:DUF2846 domain-containing protein [Marinobacter sp. chi1]|uniref:DUF2846 domain-containing protein n=1 Tax=Marinobacter suaedae TaxID=3057675 RepID=A0ABT8VWA1_9GAMM|nr:DUF2846 domain-containing protein [Marinobacter sp. chi1]MDO3720267.1 DUF2846 domain-containing protein [Marinobacter sp. chi1]
MRHRILLALRAIAGYGNGWARVLLVLALISLSGCKIYQSIGKSVGGFVHPVSGHDFVHIPNDEWNRKNALIYFYRPHSRWAGDEIESPSVYIDDKHYFNFRNDSFTWLEVKPGERQINMRRPLLGLEGMGSFALSMIVDAKLNVEAGRIYYLRYSEVSQPESVHPDMDSEHPLAQGDLQWVTRDYAMGESEIVSTRFLNSDMLAPNHAATSIVEVNEDTDYERAMAALEEEREVEIERLKAQGLYYENPWYWPFGSSSSLEADRKIEELEAAYVELEEERERQEELESGGGWWIF